MGSVPLGNIGEFESRLYQLIADGGFFTFGCLFYVEG